MRFLLYEDYIMSQDDVPHSFFFAHAKDVSKRKINECKAAMKGGKNFLLECSNEHEQMEEVKNSRDPLERDYTSSCENTKNGKSFFMPLCEI